MMYERLRASVAMRNHLRPHVMAYRVDEPCAVCGGNWLRPVVDLSDMDADELPVIDACAFCKTRPAGNDEEAKHA